MSLVLVGMGILLVWRSLSPPATPVASNGEPSLRSVRRVGLGALGLVAGLLNALSGAYGPFTTSAVMLASRAKPSRVVGTVNLAEFFVAGAVTTAVLWLVGLRAFSWQLALALTLGGAVTAPVAAYVCRCLPPRVLVFCVGLALISLNLGVVLSWLR